MVLAPLLSGTVPAQSVADGENYVIIIPPVQSKNEYDEYGKSLEG